MAAHTSRMGWKLVDGDPYRHDGWNMGVKLVAWQLPPTYSKIPGPPVLVQVLDCIGGMRWLTVSQWAFPQHPWSYHPGAVVMVIPSGTHHLMAVVSLPNIC